MLNRSFAAFIRTSAVGIVATSRGRASLFIGRVVIGPDDVAAASELGSIHNEAPVFGIVIGAQLFSGVFRGLGGDDMVHEFLTSLPGGTFGAMVVVMAIMFVLGFFLDFIEISFVVVPIVAPILLLMDLNPIWLGIMIAINLQTSFLTPPFGFALFYLRGVAPPSVTTLQIYKGVIPFVAIQVVALFIVAVYPELTTWLPSVIFGP